MRSPTPDALLRVAVGIVRDAQDRVLIGRRKSSRPHPGKWEFPGGKIEHGESTAQALRRELNEELGIDVVSTYPLIEIEHEYPGRHVHLDVHIVESFTGRVTALENQALRWVEVDALIDFDLLEANVPIVKSLIAGSVRD